MKKFVVNKFGLVTLTIVFLLLYGYFNAVGLLFKTMERGNQDGNTSADSVMLGDLGGFHLLENITYSNERTYYRIAIYTRLNRPTVIDESIATPYTKIEQLPANESIFLDGQYRGTQSMGDYRIQVSLSDTRTFDLSGTEAIEIFKGDKRTIINQDPITEVRLVQPPDDAMVQIVIGLSQKAKFRSSSNDTGTIFIDILK